MNFFLHKIVRGHKKKIKNPFCSQKTELYTTLLCISGYNGLPG